MEQGKSYSIGELAALTGFSTRRIHYLIQSGALEARGKRGRGTKYPQSTLDRLMFIRTVQDRADIEIPPRLLAQILEQTPQDTVAAVASGKEEVLVQFVTETSAAQVEPEPGKRAPMVECDDQYSLDVSRQPQRSPAVNAPSEQKGPETNPHEHHAWIERMLEGRLERMEDRLLGMVRHAVDDRIRENQPEWASFVEDVCAKYLAKATGPSGDHICREVIAGVQVKIDPRKVDNPDELLARITAAVSEVSPGRD